MEAQSCKCPANALQMRASELGGFGQHVEERIKARNQTERHFLALECTTRTGVDQICTQGVRGSNPLVSTNQSGQAFQPVPPISKGPRKQVPTLGTRSAPSSSGGGVANCTSPTLSIYAGNLQRFTICVRDTSRGVGNPADAEDLLPVVLDDRRRGNEALGTDQEQIALQHVFEKGETDLDVFEGRRLLAGPPSRGVRSDLLGDPVLFGPPGGAGSDAGELLRYSHLGDADGEVGHAVA